MLCLQEVHGTKAEVDDIFLEFTREWLVYVSLGPDWSTGGVAILVRKTFVGKDAIVEDVETCAGRALKVVISCGDLTTCFWNLHNFGIVGKDLGCDQK